MEPTQGTLKYYQRSCPNCNKVIEADFVDIGVGMQQSGPFGCEACGWCELSPEEEERIYGLRFEDDEND